MGASSLRTKAMSYNKNKSVLQNLIQIKVSKKINIIGIEITVQSEIKNNSNNQHGYFHTCIRVDVWVTFLTDATASLTISLVILCREVGGTLLTVDGPLRVDGPAEDREWTFLLIGGLWLLGPCFLVCKPRAWITLQWSRMLQRMPQFYITKLVFGETIGIDALLLWLAGFYFIN